MPHVRRPASFVLAALFFFGPAGAYLAGVRAAPIENHPLRSFPGLSSGWAFFEQMSAWSIDHLPLRGEAVRANVALNERMFGEPPAYTSGDSGPIDAQALAPSGVQTQQSDQTYPRVIQGTDGWLYFGGDVSSLCQPQMSVSEVMSRLERLSTAIERSGRRFVFTVAPDKSTVWPKNLPASYLGEDCATARRTAFWTAVRTHPPTGYFDVRGPIEAVQQRTGQSSYWKEDTHWGQYAAATYAERLAMRVDPTVFRSPPAISCGGTATRLGDLSAILGRPETDTMAACQIAVGDTPITGSFPVVPGSTTPDFGSAPVKIDNRYAAKVGFSGVRDRTLLLGDSFSSASRPYLFPLFEDLTLLQNQTAGQSPSRVADAIVNSDVVAYEIVERTVAGGQDAFLAERTVQAVERALRAHPLHR
ncbi:MAG TPA: hypothetical protein VIS06_02800 [Mycobacteriales bacterium]